MSLTEKQFTKQALSQVIPFIQGNEELPHGTLYAIHDEYFMVIPTEDFDPENIKIIRYSNLKQKVENFEDEEIKPTLDQILEQLGTITRNPNFVAVIPMSELTYAAKTKIGLKKEYRNSSREDALRLITAYGKNGNI